jgi:alpha-1,6-mannosyltransferase
LKILDVTEFYSERGGGVRSHLALKSHVLCQLGHDHVVLAPGARDEVARSPEGARVIRLRSPALPYDRTYHQFLRFDKIARRIEAEQPDVLEIHSPYIAALGALRAKPGTYGVRTFQWHSDFIDTYAGVLEPRLAPMLRAMLPVGTRPLWGWVRGITKRCDATLVAAQWQVDKLRSHGVPRVRRVPFGIERSVFRREARSYERRRELLALAGHDANDDACAVLVGLGRFAIEKRWDVVIDAFLRVRRERPCVLVLFGDGPEKERMRARAAGSPDFAMPGFTKGREALASSLASADAMVHGCPFETFGLSIAEAMSCGLPAVVPDAGGAGEMHEEGAGERYRALDVDACAHAVLRLLDRMREDEERVRAATSRAVSKLPTVREQFESQVALYKELLAR